MIGGTTFRKRLKDCGFETVVSFSDRRYSQPSKAWVEKFGDWVSKHQPSKFAPDSFDCDDFARWARFRASMTLIKNPALVAKESTHTFIEAWVYIKAGRKLNDVAGGQTHATNLVLASDDKFYWFEPQNGRITSFNKAKASIEKLVIAFP